MNSSPDDDARPKTRTRTAAPFNIVWLIFSPGTLDDIWNWVQDLATVWQVLVWLLTLPYMVALAIWESDWQTWLRILLVVLIALFWTGLTNSPKPAKRGA